MLSRFEVKAWSLEDKVILLKGLRGRLLSFHKILIDREKLNLEVTQGPITPGQWLGMLMSDDEHEWLRSISKLVVRIDEYLEIKDGLSEEKIDGFMSDIKGLFDESDDNEDFKEKVGSRVQNNPEAESVRSDLVELLETI